MPRGLAKAPYSQSDVLALMDLSPCALILYHWMQTIGTVKAEIHLEEFATFSYTGRSNGYSMMWIKESFHELVSAGLVSIDQHYNSKVFRVTIWNPGRTPTKPADRIKT
jgi:hypothetical protein